MRQLSLEQLQHRFYRLRRLLSRIRLPPIDSFEAYGKTYSLPMRVEHTKAGRHVPPRSLEYLAGFFDGDGCARNTWSRSSVRLEIHQSSINAKVLLFFKNLLGGGIYVGRSRGTGLFRPTVRWELSGAGAAHAAALLSTVSSCKQPQLKVISSWPQCMSARRQSATNLQLLKKLPPATANCPSWAFLAGFFDAEGCISVRPSASIVVTLGQKHDPVLHCIKRFLADRGLDSSLYKARSVSMMVITRTEASREILRQLLSAGLRVKRESARIALRLSSTNFYEVREQLQGLVGNQARYQRLTRSGTERASQIKRCRQRLEYAQASDKPEIAAWLAYLQHAHEMASARERYVQVRADARALLQHAED
ncbi:USP [Symbiodinium sp. CCMP2592]|nr:USP [Symbiodinium sp. CCMP2592]